LNGAILERSRESCVVPFFQRWKELVDLVIMIIEGVVELLQANRLFETLFPLAYIGAISGFLEERKAGLALRTHDFFHKYDYERPRSRILVSWKYTRSRHDLKLLEIYSWVLEMILYLLPLNF